MSIDKNFDYVVIGGGSAGCVLANRLTADMTTRVLLLEAGGDDSLREIQVPALFGTLLGTRVDWAYRTIPQSGTGTSIAVPRGRVLGGCSSINAMVYVRGNRADYDEWRTDKGATGWGYDEVLPYFVRAERNERLHSQLHGVDGPMHVADPTYVHELNQLWVESAAAWGLPTNPDFNGPDQTGVGTFQFTQYQGKRWSTADGYLRPALQRPNLTLATNAVVHRIVIDGHRATGVIFDHAGTNRTAHVDGEIMLSAGTIGSPQLLMLSGIGPAKHLREVGIDIVADVRAVGANLHDHPTIPVIWSTHDSTDVIALATDPKAMRAFQSGRPGPLNSALCDVGGFFSTEGDTARPTFQIHAAPTAFADGLTLPAAPSFTGTVSLLDPASRGTLRLQSRNPTQAPRIDLGIYSDTRDFSSIVDGVNAFIDMTTSGPVSRYMKTRYFPTDAHPNTTEFRAALRAHTQTMYHPVGTCTIGPEDDGVVDADLRVHGVDGLRVIDASVMPLVPRGNTNAATIMIAEKAADLIQRPRFASEYDSREVARIVN